METRLLIGGELVAGNGPELAVEDPAREETIAAVGTPDAEQLDAAIAAARTAQREHVHIETKLEIKDWWYPYGGGEAPPHGA